MIREQAQKNISWIFSVYGGLQVVTFLISFSFFSVYIADASEKTWRLEKRAEILKNEERLLNKLKESIILENAFVSHEVQEQIARFCSAIITASATNELIPFKTKWFFSRITLETQISIREHIEVDTLKIISTTEELIPGVYDPDKIGGYNLELRNAIWKQTNSNEKVEKNIQKLLESLMQSMVPDITTTDATSKLIEAAISGFTEAKLKLVNRSGEPIRAYALYTFLTISGIEPQPIRISTSLGSEMVEALKVSHVKFAQDVQEQVVVERENITNLKKQTEIEVTWEQRIRKFGNQLARAASRAL